MHPRQKPCSAAPPGTYVCHRT